VKKPKTFLLEDIAMSFDKVHEYLKKWGRDRDIMEFPVSSATVELAARALGVKPARIAKTLAFGTKEGGAMLVVTAGDAKTDNSRFKAEFGFKAKMLTPDETFSFTGHAVGGVCPFGLKTDLPVYLDVSLKRFKTVFPACGSSNSAIELTCGELEVYSQNKKWVDVCKNWS
jgi:prolyl-tRNA editing enzyme YbaK/EbsC (Cys-tRNA(Pro) deacylase)